MFVGIDSHKDTLAACVVDVSGREVRSAAFENSPAGHLDLLRWARQAGDLERFGIEGSANLAAGLARRLMAEGEAVFEVPCEMTVRERRRLRRPGKSDPADALAIARVTAREHTLPPARQAGVAEDLKVLSDYRDQLVVERNAEVNRLHADLAIVCPGYARHCRSLVAARALVTASRLLRGDASRRGMSPGVGSGGSDSWIVRSLSSAKRSQGSSGTAAQVLPTSSGSGRCSPPASSARWER